MIQIPKHTLKKDSKTGSSHPLGATLGGSGANFSLFSRSATRVELLFFNRADSARSNRTIELPPLDQADRNPWQRWIDTAQESPNDIVPWEKATSVQGLTYRADARSVVALYAPAS